MVHFFRNTAFVRSMSLALATSLTAVSCAQQEVVAPLAATPTRADLKAYSGDQLFAGIFLLEGAVAAKLPALQGPRLIIEKENRRNASYVQYRAARCRQLTAAVRALDPAYLSELQQAVASQQFDRIEAAIRKGSLLLKAVCLGKSPASAQVVSAQQFLRSADVSKYNFAKEEDVDRFISAMEGKKREFATSQGLQHAPAGSSADLYSQNSIAFAFEIAVALEVVVVVTLVWVVGAQQPSDTASALEHETLIKEIALNLRPAS